MRWVEARDAGIIVGVDLESTDEKML